MRQFIREKVCWPGGTLGHAIIGSGRKITNEELSVDDNVGAGIAGGIFRNWRRSVLYYDTAGDQYYKRVGATHSPFTNVIGIGQKFPQTITLAKNGKACAIFEANGKILARQCHNITD